LPILHEAVAESPAALEKPFLKRKNGAAAILGLHPSTLRVRMDEIGIVRAQTKKPD
jgi:hypothetical protein